MLLNSTKNSPVATGWNPRLLANWNGKKTFQKVRLTYKGPKLNVLIRDKISFVGGAHLTRGGRSCLWALYRWFWTTTRILHSVFEEGLRYWSRGLWESETRKFEYRTVYRGELTWPLGVEVGRRNQCGTTLRHGRGWGGCDIAVKVIHNYVQNP